MVCRGTKPDPPERSDAADLPLFAALLRDRVTLYADLCGVSLHRRGYRSVMHRASLNEAAAAGVLALAGWTAQAAGQRCMCHEGHGGCWHVGDPPALLKEGDAAGCCL